MSTIHWGIIGCGMLPRPAGLAFRRPTVPALVAVMRRTGQGPGLRTPPASPAPTTAPTIDSRPQVDAVYVATRPRPTPAGPHCRGPGKPTPSKADGAKPRRVPADGRRLAARGLPPGSPSGARSRFLLVRSPPAAQRSDAGARRRARGANEVRRRPLAIRWQWAAGLLRPRLHRFDLLISDGPITEVSGTAANTGHLRVETGPLRRPPSVAALGTGLELQRVGAVRSHRSLHCRELRTPVFSDPWSCLPQASRSTPFATRRTSTSRSSRPSSTSGAAASVALHRRERGADPWVLDQCVIGITAGGRKLKLRAEASSSPSPRAPPRTRCWPRAHRSRSPAAESLP